MESREFLEEFIYLYKSHPCLWKYSCKDYHNKSAKDKAFADLLEKLREIDPQANESSVVHKINTLKMSFRREYDTLCNYSKEGYVPSLWYYEQLRFIVDEQSNQANPSVDVYKDLCEDTKSLGPVQIKLEPSTYSASSPYPLNEVDQDLKAAYDADFDGIGLPTTHSTSKGQEEPSEIAEDVRIVDLARFGDYVISKLKRVSRKQGIIAEKVIAEVLMRATLGTLDATTGLTSCLP